ncbi:MAG: ribokinase [Phycisphaerae bacterium]|jgi:ribokinase|nr:MAG: ribokinase [Phycisphaerae bacterium]
MVQKKRAKIVVIGSVNMDLVIECDRLPHPGETLTGQDCATIPGGKGANQAVAAARLGADVYMVGRIGDDTFGRVLRDGLEKNGVNTHYLKTTRGVSSGTAMIVVQKGGENSIILSPGANGKVTAKDVESALPVIRNADAVLLQLEIPTSAVLRAVKLCKKHGVMSVLDPAPAPVSGLSQGLYRVDIISPNETEAATILKGKNTTPEWITRRLLEEGAGHVVLKLGKRGSVHADRTGVMTHVKGFKIRPVDTTAAGDSFTAGLAVARAEGLSWADALRFANACGAIACTRFGAQPSLPRRNEVLRLLRSS